MDGKWRHVLQWLKDMGVNEVYDASFGADICTYLHLEYVKQNPNAKIISQPCAAIVNYAEKHKPELLPKLSPVHSPLLCTAVYVKKYLGNHDTLIGLTPCIAKGDEFANTEEIGFTGMHPWEGEPDFRVLSYSKNVAKVYYFSDTGGEKALFTRENGAWNYERSTKAWSAVGGTADDYLIWPYFKDWVI
jgi:hypothetical protein